MAPVPGEPGGICLSEDAYRQVRARLDLAVSDLGETKLKNIAEPLRAYLVDSTTRAVVASREFEETARVSSESPYGAVLAANSAAHIVCVRGEKSWQSYHLSASKNVM